MSTQQQEKYKTGVTTGNKPTQLLTAPDTQIVRECIENVADQEIQICLKFIYLVAARSIEAVGHICPKDKHYKYAYGPRGVDVETINYQPKVPQWAKVLVSKKQLEESFAPIPTALFTVKIAKKRLATGEDPHYRIIALPIGDQYDPWVKEVADYFKQRGGDLVFPFTRQYLNNYLNRHKVFKDLHYPIEKYVLTQKLDVVKVVDGKQVTKENTTILSHLKRYRAHAIRHTRTTNLREDYHFSGLDLASFIGWSLGSANKTSGEATPAMLSTYARIYTNWKAYYPKLIGNEA